MQPGGVFDQKRWGVSAGVANFRLKFEKIAPRI